MDAKSLGPVIRKWRIEGGFTQQELGRRAGLPKRTVGAIERGERAPERSELVQLSQALGKEPADLLTRWYRNELDELNKMRASKPQPEAPPSPDSRPRIDQIIDQIAALAKELYRESRSDFQKAFLDWLSPSDLPRSFPSPSASSRPRKRVSRKRGSTKA